MIERTWQIRRVYGKVVKNNQLTSTVTGFLEVGGGIGAVLSIQIIIMIVWTVVDPFTSISILGRTPFEATYECASTHTNLWLSLETVYFGILLVTFETQFKILIINLALGSFCTLFHLVDSHIYCRI